MKNLYVRKEGSRQEELCKNAKNSLIAGMKSNRQDLQLYSKLNTRYNFNDGEMVVLG